MAEDSSPQVVVFELASETYALEINHVIEIIRIQPVTPVPGASDYIEGLINLRGRVVPVVDLRKRFYLPARATGDRSRIIIVQVADDIVGAVVDAVSEVIMVNPDLIEPAAKIVSGVDAEYIRTIAKIEGHLVAVLNPDKILEYTQTEEEEVVLEAVK
jgi:purine-binding chemotaxis protein CheW